MHENGAGEAEAHGLTGDDAPPFSGIVEQATQSIIVYDAEGIVRFWNPAATRLYGWPASTTIGYCLDPLAWESWINRDDIGDSEDWSGTVTRRRIDGDFIDVAVRIVRFSGAAGRPASFVEFGPVPEHSEPPSPARTRERDEEAPALHSSVEPGGFKRLLEHMPVPLWQVDARSPGQAFETLRMQGVTDIASYLARHPELVEFACNTVVVTDVNRAAVAMLGGTEVQFLNPVRYIFEATPEAAVRVMTAHFNGERNHIEEIRINTFDGRALDVLFLVTFPRPPEDMTVTFITMVDITDQVRAETELRQLQADFAHAARISMLGEMVATIAHEVKQPLTAIVANGGASMRWLSRGGSLDRVADRIERIIESAEHANEIILRIQRMAANREPVWTDLDINDVVDEALRFIGRESRERRIVIATRLAPDLPRISGDRVQLNQLLVNLLVNSFQAIDGSESSERSVQIESNHSVGWIEIAVTDSGPGIAPENLDKVFKGFFTTKETGMGIGLAVCQSVAGAHGGSIDIQNLDGGGAMVRVKLPVSRVTPQTRWPSQV
ncbi:PAS domain S-box-containing protein [Sphingopyxis sp. YR583]|jgi:PAS domain S-box-containing protein|uniref:PAS domain-containing sensor histidine kinase n=1 Tax=Sphingopyxis sp. YR583 TaxID=1881047 RepID=UPI0008A7D1B5|nr:ATP-binding protein [Sphingopyxis sp. YR583]SEH13316.1 PAS domain S-box-containing protein [Sphingopyxis sp. YR583]